MHIFKMKVQLCKNIALDIDSHLVDDSFSKWVKIIILSGYMKLSAALYRRVFTKHIA